MFIFVVSVIMKCYICSVRVVVVVFLSYVFSFRVVVFVCNS